MPATPQTDLRKIMKNEVILWLVLGSWAAILLLAMMRRRQQALDRLLQGYVRRETQAKVQRQKAARAAAKTATRISSEADATLE